MNVDKITVWMKFAGKILDKLANILDFVRAQFADIDFPGKTGGGAGGAGAVSSGKSVKGG